MKTAFAILIVIFSFGCTLFAQTRTIHGFVLDEDLQPSYVFIGIADSMRFGQTDLNGRFKIDIPPDINTLTLRGVGVEPATIKLKDDCDTVEIITMYDGTYDFMSFREIDRIRLKRFKKLTELREQALKSGIFKNNVICYTQDFAPWKPHFDSVKRAINLREKVLKQIFKKIAPGDTIKIPFHTTDKKDGTNSVILNGYSAHTDRSRYDLTITGVITEKNTKKGGFNLVYKVVGCECDKHTYILSDKPMRTGDVLTHNMRRYKILNK